MEGTNRSSATAMFFLGEGTHSPVDVREEQVRRTSDQIDVVSKAFLGLTVACARCHDHKFDAITQRDYYAPRRLPRKLPPSAGVSRPSVDDRLEGRGAGRPQDPHAGPISRRRAPGPGFPGKSWRLGT